jgi:pyrroloquinoline quinone (PQQ) biosynthesis protein C
LNSEFERQLFKAARESEITTNPFVLGVRDGRCPTEALRDYATDLAILASGFPRVLSSILACCDAPDVRRALLANLLEEEGVVSFQSGAGLLIEPQRHHGAMAWRLARAAGANESDAPQLETGSRWLSEELHAGRWIGPLAFITLGYEAHVPPTFRLLLEGLRQHYHFAEADLVFLTEHLDADERHGAEGAALIARVAVTAELQAQAIAGARRGAKDWHLFHRKHARALRKSARHAAA